MGYTTAPGKIIDGKVIEPLGGMERDQNDLRAYRHGMDRHVGFEVGKYLQQPPLLFTRHKHCAWLGDMFRGHTCFLICGGPSFGRIPDAERAKLYLPGVLTMTLNNSIRTFRSNLWCEVDNPQNFVKSVWLDPQVMKFVPQDHTEKPIFDNESWRVANQKVGECPNVWFYPRNEYFQANQFLFEDSVNWGNHGDRCHCGHLRQNKEKQCPSCKHKDRFGCRSVMLAAMRILFYLGVRKVYLLGADFKMVEGQQNYHFQQDRSRSSVKNNNKTYSMLNVRFAELRPIFEQNELYVYNCNPESGLKAFDYVPFEDALLNELQTFPDFMNERTEGLYDRQANEKKAAKAPVPEQAPACAPARERFKTLQQFADWMEGRRCQAE